MLPDSISLNVSGENIKTNMLNYSQILVFVSRGVPTVSLGRSVVVLTIIPTWFSTDPETVFREFRFPSENSCLRQVLGLKHVKHPAGAKIPVCEAKNLANS